MAKRKLCYYGGNGFESVRNENGYFEIKQSEKSSLFFKNLTEAKAVYDAMDGEKFFWDITTIPELIDGYFYK